jgi:hypothetical protein
VLWIFVYGVVIVRDDGTNEQAAEELGNGKVYETDGVVREEVELCKYPSPVCQQEVPGI